jgi:hypothetical protein
MWLFPKIEIRYQVATYFIGNCYVLLYIVYVFLGIIPHCKAHQLLEFFTI